MGTGFVLDVTRGSYPGIGGALGALPFAAVRNKSLTSLLFVRRQVWWPTLWAWALLLLVSVAALVVCARLAYDFLAPHQLATTSDGRSARTLVVEGWLDEAELSQAVAAFRSGRYERVLTTGGPIESWQGLLPWRNYAQRAAEHLRSHGVEGVPVVAVAAPASAQDRTFLSAVMVREWARQAGVTLDAVDVFSGGVHARRSWLVYRMALGDAVAVGVFAATPKEYEPARWWRTSAGAKTVIGEGLSLAWTKCCFWPDAPGSHAERWGVGR